MRRNKSMPVKKLTTTSTAEGHIEGGVTFTKKEEGNVYYEKSVTKNLGNYESAKVTVGVTLPLDPKEDTIASIKRTLEIADQVITEELEIQIKELVDK